MNDNFFEKKRIASCIDDLDARILLKLSSQLSKDWSNFNYWYFNRRLKKPVFNIYSRSNHQWGYWDEGNRTIGINVKLIENYSWESVTYVLKHEMAHQYAYDVLNGLSEKPHGESFQKACLLLSIPGYATCDFNETKSEVSEQRSIVKKVKKMFALAQSSNEHEANTAMVMANRLLLKYNVSLVEENEERDYIYGFLGEMSGRTPKEKVAVGSILGNYFFVEVIWSPSYDSDRGVSGARLQIFGTKENVEVAEYVYHFLLNQSELLWRQYKKENNLRVNRSKKSYILGVLAGFRSKLDLEAASSKERGLIWLGDPELDHYFKRLNPKVVSGVRSSLLVDRNAMNAGQEKGRKLTLAFGLNDKSSKGRLIGHKS